MSFGAIYTALYFAFVIGVLTLGNAFSGRADLVWSRRGGVVLLAVVAIELLRGRAWARWTALLLVVAIGSAILMAGAPGGPGLAALLGAATSLVLLLPSLLAGREGRPRPAAGGRVGPLPVVAALAAIVIVVGLYGGAAAPDPSSVAPAAREDALRASSDRVAWTTFGDALALGSREQLPILVSFETAWCGYCKKMNRETWTDPRVVERLGEILAVRIDAEETLERDGHRGIDVARRYKVSSYPTLMLLNADGRVVARADGYLPPGRFLSWLDGQLGSRPRKAATKTIPVVGR